MEKSILYTKSYDLTIAAYKTVAAIKEKYQNNQVADWLFQDISSISLNFYIANEYKSKRSFLIKLYIAKRSAARSLFWTALLRSLDIVTEEEADTFSLQLTEILKMTGASINTMTKKKKEEKVKS